VGTPCSDEVRECWGVVLVRLPDASVDVVSSGHTDMIDPGGPNLATDLLSANVRLTRSGGVR
jgi:hypothetical protein